MISIESPITEIESPITEMEVMKQCTKCQVIKRLEDFHDLKTGKMGKHSNCKDCRRMYRKNLQYVKPIAGKLKCEQCNQIKLVNMFYADKSKSTGLQSYCIQCHKEKIYESSSKLEGYLKNLHKNLKTYCQQKNIEFFLSLGDIMERYNDQNNKCYLSDELLTYYNGPNLTNNSYESKFNIRVIRQNKNEGYQKENIILVGNIIYKMIGQLELKEFIRLCGLVHV
jgi:hypothetical protein